MQDDWETIYLSGDGEPDDDADGDGLTNLEEHDLQTNPNSTDSDGDNLSDGVEVNIRIQLKWILIATE